jgi:ubiquinone/menaquinone biosynthesis C-methylase UbiE
MKLWDIKASGYDRFRRLPFFHWILEKEIEALQSLIHPIPDRYEFVIDLGIGVGSTLGIFPNDILIIGLDHSFKMIRRSLKYREAIIGVVGSVNHLPFRKNCTPLVTAIGLSEYIRDKSKFIGEINRVLKKEGYVLTTISPPSFLNRLRNLLGNRVYLVEPESWKKLLQSHGWTYLGERKTLLQRQYLHRF